MRKPTLCICKNKDADQLCGNRTADQRLCFSYMDSRSWYKGFKHSRFTNVPLPCSQPLFNMAEKHVKYSGCRSAHKMSIYLQIIQLSVKSLCCAQEKCINLTSYLYHNVEIKLLHPLIFMSGVKSVLETSISCCCIPGCCCLGSSFGGK